MTAAACRGVPVNLFFPLRGESGARAREICAGCPCLSACRTFALTEAAPVHGIVAGLTALERRRLRAELHRASPTERSLSERAVAAPRRRRGSGPPLLAPFPKITATATETAWTMTQLLAARATPD